VPELSRSQLVVYGAIGVALLLLGARWIRSSEEVVASAPAGAGVTVASTPVASSGRTRVVVHVAGEVRKPGVYELAAGARVADAVEEAGGATGDAALDGINLAASLADGQQVVVPVKATNGGAHGVGVAGGADAPISLGTATVEQLETIEGIGPVTAGKIVEFRDQNGGVGSIEELEAIHGIGPATIDRLRERLQP
jgi:competence protein ComEA